MCPVIACHDSHFLLLLDLLLFLLVVLHYLQPLGLHQAAFLDVELFFGLQEETQFTQHDLVFLIVTLKRVSFVRLKLIRFILSDVLKYHVLLLFTML